MATKGTDNWQQTDAGQKMMSTFSEERTLHALDGLLQKVETLEKAVDNLTVLVNRGPGLAAMVGDMADEAYRKADDRGVNIDERLKSALVLAEKLTAPEMVEKINGLVSLTNQAPGLAAMAGDMVDEAYRNADDRGVSIDERLKVAGQLAERLTDPVMVNKLEGLMQLADQSSGLTAMTVDMVDEAMRHAIEKGIDPKAIVEALGHVMEALSKSHNEPTPKVGVFFGVMRAFGDPDRQRAIGFIMNFLKHWGERITT